jgi:hypothetical protein
MVAEARIELAISGNEPKTSTNPSAIIGASSRSYTYTSLGQSHGMSSESNSTLNLLA